MTLAIYLAGKILLGLFFSSVLAGLGYLSVTMTLISLGYVGPVAIRVAVFTGPVVGAALGASWGLFQSEPTWKRRVVIFAATLGFALAGSWIALQYAQTIPRRPFQWGTPALAGVILGATFAANIPATIIDGWRTLSRGRI